MRKPFTCSGLLLLSILLMAGSIGCVERRIVFTSNLTDTKVNVWLDGHPIGETPHVQHFENYGKREWQARADGYETASGRIELEVPWYQWPVFDFFSEVLLPFTIVDEHYAEIELRPLEHRSVDDLMKRASAFRKEAIEEAKKEPDIGDKRK